LKQKYYFPNLKPFLKKDGTRFTNFVRESNSSLGVSISERTFHNATNPNIGVSETTKNSILKACRKVFTTLDIECSDDAILVKSVYEDLFQ